MELWDRWQRGESLKAIGRAFGKPSSNPSSQDRTPRCAILSVVSPAAASYRASGLVLWPGADI